MKIVKHNFKLSIVYNNQEISPMNKINVMLTCAIYDDTYRENSK